MRRLGASLAAALLATLTLPSPGASQQLADAVLRGRVLLGDGALDSGTVVLHRMSDDGAGEIDSARVGPDGSFSVRLPGVPNPALGELYFASLRHAGVMYFGRAVETPMDLDSLYVIQAYDTLFAPAEGVEVAIQARNIFLEPNGEVWQATDVFQLRNDRDRTVIARPGGRVWSYPLPAEAREVMTGEGEVAPGAVAFEGGAFVVRAALPPGERLFVVRYQLDSPEVTIPTPGETELFDILVREPAPPLSVEAMQQVANIDLEAGQTFRRYAAENLVVPSISIVRGEADEPPPVEWIAVALALVLAIGGLLAWRGQPRAEVVPVGDRRAILVQLARLDEEFERRASPSEAETREYRRRRAELMRRLTPGS